MRTYAPATTATVLDRLLEEPSLARGGRPPRGHPGAARPTSSPFPDWLDRRIVDGLAESRASSASTATRPRRSRPSMPARTSSSSRRRRRARRCATRCRSSRRSPTTRPRGPSSSSRPRPSARTRSPSSPGSGDGERAPGRGGDLRRRHAGADPVGHPDRRPGRRHEPGHAPLGDPPPPHEVVPALRAAPGHRHRRAPHLPRRVRQPRRERPPAAPPAVPPLRLEPGDRVLLGDDREPGRARRPAHRPAGAPHRPQRRAARRAPRPARRPADPRRGDRAPAARP